MCLFPQETVNSKRTRTMTISCSLLYPQKMVLYTHTCIGTVYPLSSTISQSLLKLISIELVMLSNHLILCHTLLLSPSVFPSIRVFSNESVVHIKRPEYWSFSIIPSSEYFLYTYFIFISGIINIIFKGNLK